MLKLRNDPINIMTLNSPRSGTLISGSAVPRNGTKVRDVIGEREVGLGRGGGVNGGKGGGVTMALTIDEAVYRKA